MLAYFCFNKVKTVEEQVRASAEHKLGVANQSITAGFFDNNTRYIRILVKSMSLAMLSKMFWYAF